MTDSLLAEAKAILGCSDAEIAELMGINPNTATAYIKGARREYLSAGQVEHLKTVLNAYRDGVAAAIERFELLA